MEYGKIGTYNPAHRIMGNHQLVIITRLLQVVETMETIDELFAWLAEMIIQRMDVQVVQFWAMQAYTHGRESCALRTMACQSTSLPQHIVVNQPLADAVEQSLNKQQSVAPRSVGTIFSHYYSEVLMRYNLNYWACHFMSNNILLPVTRDSSSYEKIATPLTLGITVFLQHPPSSRLLPTLAHTLEHTLPIARKHGLLKISTPIKQGLQLESNQYTGKRPALTAFTPYHTQTEHTVKQALIPRSIIQDKNARRLYLEIDGHKNIGELASEMQLNAEEFYAALSLLLTQKRIQIFGGQGFVSERAQSLQS